MGKGEGPGWPHNAKIIIVQLEASDFLLIRCMESNGGYNGFPSDGGCNKGQLAVMALLGKKESTTQDAASAFLPTSFVPSNGEIG